MPTAPEHLENIKNVLKQRKLKAQQEAEQLAKTLQHQILDLQEQIQAIERIQDTWANLDETQIRPGTDLSAILAGATTTRQATTAPISDSIYKYVRETGKKQFSAADIKKYLESQGYQGKWLYNSIYETLTRWTTETPARAVKVSGKFELACEHGNRKENCQQCRSIDMQNSGTNSNEN